MKILNKKLISSFLPIFTFISFLSLNAGGDAVGEMKFLLEGGEGRSVEESLDENSDSLEDPDGGIVDDVDEGGENEDVRSSGCGPEAIVPIETCEIGQGTLCLNTPPLSVAGDYVIIKGSVDKRTSAFSHIRVYRQHEYTKEFQEIKLEKSFDENCWESSWVENYQLCIDEKGLFGLKVPLPEPGPYTIMIDAVSLDGESVSKTIRTSKVIEPEIGRTDVTISPDPDENDGIIRALSVNVHVDILGDCSFCDFIGVSTDGLTIKVTNRIEHVDGSVKEIVRRSNILRGKSVDVCTPILSGKNVLTVEACNAAVSEGDCPSVSGIEFQVIADGAGIDLISPDISQLSYDMSEADDFLLKFAVPNLDQSTACENKSVKVKWNHHDAVALCSNSEGIYSARLIPEVGINSAVIEVEESGRIQSRNFVIGWGKIVNPYRNKEDGWIHNSLSLYLGSSFLNNKLRSLINNFFSSGGIGSFISGFLEESGGSAEVNNNGDDIKKSTIREIKKEIPFCGEEGDFGDVAIKLIGEPRVDWAELETLEFNSSKMSFKLDMEGVEAHLRVFQDKDKNGRPDDKILPLMIGIRGAQIDGRVEVIKGANPLFLITSENNDCDFKSGSYCKEKPALLIPQNLVGGATKGGSFVRCDNEHQQIDENTDSACRSLNILASQTGILNQKVLDLLNDKLYCDGSAYLTYFMRKGMDDISFNADFIPEKDLNIVAGVLPTNEEIEISESGIWSDLSVRFGNPQAVDKMDPNVADPNIGIFTDPYAAVSRVERSSRDSLELSLSTSVLDQILMQLIFQPGEDGILDWDLDEISIKKLGFDYVENCDKYDPTVTGEKPSALCEIRPRLSRFLGQSLVTHGYFTPSHPLRIKVRGSRRLVPHVRLYSSDVPYEVIVEGKEEAERRLRPAEIFEVQIPDIKLSIFPLKIDESREREYGNLPIYLDENSEPVVVSMIEGRDEPVPIITVRLSLLLAMEIFEVRNSLEDPTKLELLLRPDKSLTRIIIQKVEGGNPTIVPDENLFSALLSKINIGLNEFEKLDEEGEAVNPIVLDLPKTIDLGDFGSEENDLFERLGLKKIAFNKEGFALKLDSDTDLINIKISPDLL